LADELFKAGFELATKLGVLCVSSDRLITVTEDELKDAIRTTPRDFYVGEGPDMVHVVHRRPEDTRPVVYIGGPFANPATEEMFIPIMESCARDRRLDILIAPCMTTVYGRALKSGTALEVMGGLLEVKLSLEAMRRAGRPGMPKNATTSDMTGIGQLPSFSHGFHRRYDIPVNPLISELKIGTPGMNRMVHSKECGYVTYVYAHPMINGYAGGVEETALLGVAEELLMQAVFFGHNIESTPTDIWDLGNTGPAATWCHSLVIQAITRNTPQIFGGEVSSVMDTGLEELFYESVANAIMNAVSGAGSVNGIRSGAGRFPDHNTPLENSITAEILKDVAPGMKRTEANELLLRILPKYAKLLKSPPPGKSFQELMDVKTLKPKKEWEELEKKARKELVDIGIPLIV